MKMAARVDVEVRQHPRAGFWYCVSKRHGMDVEGFSPDDAMDNFRRKFRAAHGGIEAELNVIHKDEPRNGSAAFQG